MADPPPSTSASPPGAARPQNNNNNNVEEKKQNKTQHQNAQTAIVLGRYLVTKYHLDIDMDHWTSYHLVARES